MIYTHRIRRTRKTRTAAGHTSETVEYPARVSGTEKVFRVRNDEGGTGQEKTASYHLILPPTSNIRIGDVIHLDETDIVGFIVMATGPVYGLKKIKQIEAYL